jgi:hypothetical protein
MRQVKTKRTVAGLVGACAVATCTAVLEAKADEGGVSMWLPGIFGSLAATPQVPGWTVVTFAYHTSVKAGGNVAAAKQVSLGRFTTNLNLNLDLNLNAHATLGVVVPTYVFATPVLGGQLAVGLMALYGRNSVSVDGTLTASLGPLGFTLSGARTDTVTGFGDLYPQVSLRWNSGVHNFMTYITGDIPVGSYESTRLANIGIGHGAIDAGGGYTYFNPQTGGEFSAVLGLTHNFENEDTQYKNGVDMHLDWGTSQFLSKEFMVGLVGYVYKQIGCDSGAGDRVGCFKSQVLGVGPQAGFIFPVGNMQGYLNLKAYKEFEAENRPEGWNAWVTFVISPAPPAPAAPPKRMVRK